MTTVEILRAARELISDPARWAQGFFAKNAAGEDCYSQDPQAVSWCALGAFGKVNRDGTNTFAAWATLHNAADELFSCNIPNVNDKLGHTAVLELYDRVIALAEKEVAE